MVAIAAFLPPALSKPRFRLFALGQAISIIGGWIQQIALSWLIYRLSGSVLLLGVAGFYLWRTMPHIPDRPFVAPGGTYGVGTREFTWTDSSKGEPYTRLTTDHRTIVVQDFHSIAKFVTTLLIQVGSNPV